MTRRRRSLDDLTATSRSPRARDQGQHRSRHGAPTRRARPRSAPSENRDDRRRHASRVDVPCGSTSSYKTRATGFACCGAIRRSAFVVILTLTVGIGLTTSVFSVVDRPSSCGAVVPRCRSSRLGRHVRRPAPGTRSSRHPIRPRGGSSRRRSSGWRGSRRRRPPHRCGQATSCRPHGHRNGWLPGRSPARASPNRPRAAARRRGDCCCPRALRQVVRGRPVDRRTPGSAGRPAPLS